MRGPIENAVIMQHQRSPITEVIIFFSSAVPVFLYKRRHMLEYFENNFTAE